MARNYAQVLLRIWRDRDFLALSVPAQRMYLFLISQYEINSCGVIALTPRRWAAMAARYSVQQVEDDLTELAKGRFVIMDTATEELLVRSFMRANGVGSNRNLRIRAEQDATATRSERLRAVLAAEFARMEGASGGASEGALFATPEGTDQTSVTGIGTSTGRSNRTGSQHRGALAQEFDAFWSAYPRRIEKGRARKAFDSAVSKVAPEVIIVAARRFATECERKRTEAKYIPHPSTWLNGERWSDEPDPEPDNGPQEVSPW